MTERRTARRIPVRPGIFLGALVITLAALFVPGWVGAFLVLVIMAVLITWLRGTWPRLTRQERVLRIAILMLLLALAVFKAR